MKKLIYAGCAFLMAWLLTVPGFADIIVDPRPAPPIDTPVEPALTSPVDIPVDTNPVTPTVLALAVSLVVIAAAVMIWTVKRGRR